MAWKTFPYSKTDEHANQHEFDSRSGIHWKASLIPVEGQEGATPYLYLQHFDKAEVVVEKNNPDIDTELIFNGIQDAYTWRSRTRMVDPQSSADPTIPRTVHQKKAAVKLIFKAYKSIALATDNPGMLKAFAEQKHDNRHVETICWSIVEGCIDRCDRGPLLNAYEPDKAKNNASIKTFADRLNAIVESLSRQKTICKHLLDAPYLNRFLDDPVGSKQRVESNRKLNKKKGGVMDVGKHALGLVGKKGRLTGEKRSEESDEGVEEYCLERRDPKRESSSVSSPFRTPDQPTQKNHLNTPPALTVSPLSTTKHSQYHTPTPPSRRRRVERSVAPTPTEHPTCPSLFGEQSNNFANDNANNHGGFLPASMDMMSSSMLDPTLHTYLSSNLYRGAQTTFESTTAGMAPLSLASTIGLHKQSPYTTDMDSGFHNALVTEPTSVPFQLLEHFEALETGQFTASETGGSNDSNDSDSEYLPAHIRKRQRR